MKSLYFAAILAMATTTVFGQNSKVTSAWRYLEIQELDNAKEAIDAAVEHEKTKGKADTWILRGKIYYQIQVGEDEVLKKQFPDILDGAAESFLKVLELDEKGSYKKEVMPYLTGLRGQFINDGGAKYAEKDFNAAVNKFEMSRVISEKAFGKDTLYYMAVTNKALSYDNMKLYDEAIAEYTGLIDSDYEKESSLRSILNIYKKQKNAEKVYETAMKGREMFPDDINYILEELQYLLDTKQDEKAEKNLLLAVEKEPTNSKIRFALGVVYNNLANPESGAVEEAKYVELIGKGEAAYNKALELDSTYSDAAHNLGALHFNVGVRYVEQAKESKDDDSNQALMTKADEFFQKSLPNLEKADELSPGDREIMMSLRDLYLKLGDADKYMVYKKKVDEL
ncbi:MAG: tetratricopeptide (TPR) repeat protein [Flavobacteriales bacterium]|jgi:tetratricopeptide (TPR) repeat protein